MSRFCWQCAGEGHHHWENAIFCFLCGSRLTDRGPRQWARHRLTEGAQRVMAETYGAVYDVNGSILVQKDRNHSGYQKAYPAGPGSGRLILAWFRRFPRHVPESNWFHIDKAHHSWLLGSYVDTLEGPGSIPRDWVVRADKHSPLGCSFQRFLKTFW